MQIIRDIIDVVFFAVLVGVVLPLSAVVLWKGSHDRAN